MFHNYIFLKSSLKYSENECLSLVLHQPTDFFLSDWQMHQQGILKNDDVITRFFRLCSEMCVDLCYRAMGEATGTPPTNQALIRAKCFYTLDAFVRLIALLIKHSGDNANTVTKINLLNKVNCNRCDTIYYFFGRLPVKYLFMNMNKLCFITVDRSWELWLGFCCRITLWEWQSFSSFLITGFSSCSSLSWMHQNIS